ncbi:MAG: glycosyltransferase family 2 protein [Desulfovibrionaceae bacterium]|nr:glycosyltransferase family 2 protein [Desulfovibrionaceae bacterium]
MKYSAVCCMAKDEDPFLREWIAYHLLLGFDHCIVVDDASATPVAAVLKDWAPKDRVTIVRHEKPHGQFETYESILAAFGKDFFWLAFIDMDEFIWCANPWPQVSVQDWYANTDIRAVLSFYESYGAVGINWRMFSWSGHEKRPVGLVLANYTQCLGDATHIKSIVQPRAVQQYATPHSFYLKEGWRCVDPSFFPLAPGYPLAVPHTDQMAVYHYYYKSREDFQKKIVRGNPVHIQRSSRDFEEHIALPTTLDTKLASYVPFVRTYLRMPSLFFDRPETGSVKPSEVHEELRCIAHDIGSLQRTAQNARSLFVRLADVAMVNATNEHPEKTVMLRVWFLRARLAFELNALACAEHCLRQSIEIGATSEAYTLLAALLLRQGDIAGSKFALSISQSPKLSSSESLERGLNA